MCTGTLEFPPQTPQQRHRKARKRTLGDKLQEIGSRSPRDIDALDVIVDMILDRLDAEAQQAQKA